MVGTASGGANLWRYVVPRAAAMVLGLPLLLWLSQQGTPDPAGAFPPPANVAGVTVALDEAGELDVVTVVAGEQADRIGPLTDAVAASVTQPAGVTADHPVLAPNQGRVAGGPSRSGELVPAVALDLAGLRTRLEELGFERVELCVSTPNLVGSSTRSGLTRLDGLDGGCAELSVLVLVPGMVALGPRWTRRERRRLDARPAPL